MIKNLENKMEKMQESFNKDLELKNITEEKRSTKSTSNNQKMPIGTYISIITLNINGLNAPTERYRLDEGIQKWGPYIFCLQKTQFRPQDTYRLKVRRWKNIFLANGKEKKAGEAILISDKIDLKIKKIAKGKEGHCIMVKGSV